MPLLYFTVRFTAIVRTTLPAVALTVKTAGPVAAVDVADSFRTELPFPGAGKLDGVKVAVTPDGRPWTVNATAKLKPPRIAVVTVTEAVPPRFSTAVVTLRDIVTAGTKRVKVVVLVTPPPVADTVNG